MECWIAHILYRRIELFALLESLDRHFVYLAIISIVLLLQFPDSYNRPF